MHSQSFYESGSDSALDFFRLAPGDGLRVSQIVTASSFNANEFYSATKANSLLSLALSALTLWAAVAN